MAGTLRKLVTRLVLEGAKTASDQLRKYDTLWKATAKSVESSASAIEKAAERAGSALGRMQAGAAAVRAGAAGSAGRGGSGTKKPGKDPLDAAIRNANVVSARQAGLAAGAAQVNDATKALGLFATASDRAKAKVADLTSTVERNRKEMADLRVKVVQTGDADGTLTARMQGLSVSTNKVSGELREARRELRAVDGSLIDNIKSAANLSGRFDALKVAAGNLISGAVSRGLHGIGDALVGSAKSAMDFEKALVDVAKVAQDADLTKDGLLDPRVKQGIKDVAKELGVMPTEVAELTAQITAAFSGKTDIVALASDVTKIGVAWDISGKQAGEFFKQTSAGLQINSDETKALFGSINELGNKLGIKSAEIAEAMTRSAGVIKGANLSGETGAALNATLIKAGASAEVAATGVRTFIARLGAGEAATDKQVRAFQALGLSAESVAKNLASGDAARAENQIKEVVGALVKMGEEAPEERLATLIQLFGSESIGSIGAAATAVDTLASSFEIAGNKGAALTSVQQEYDRVSNTTAARVEKLKANIGVLAIQLGEKLLPYIDRVVNFLTSPEGQEWGAAAVEKAVGAVTTLADAVLGLGKFFGFLSDKLGGATVAVGLLGAAVFALTGPFGLAAAAAVAMGAAAATAIDSIVNRAEHAQLALLKLHNQAQAIRNQEQEAERAEQVAESDAASEQLAREKRVQAATDLWEQRERTRINAEQGGVEDLAITRKAARMREVLLTGKGAGRIGTFDERIKSFEDSLAADKWGYKGGGGNSQSGDSEGGVERFNELLAARSSRQLKPSEAKALRSLSKSLDLAIPKKPGKGREHKATKMDRQLAALDPSLAGVLTQGGDTDRGGDLKVSDDILSRGVLAAASARKGLGSVSGGSGGVGPGPNITNTNNNTTITVQQAIDARSTASVPENIRSAARESGNQAAGVILTGVDRARALKMGGARMV